MFNSLGDALKASGWAAFLVLMAFVLGFVFGVHGYEGELEQKVKKEIPLMVDNTAYVCESKVKEEAEEEAEEDDQSSKDTKEESSVAEKSS